MNKFNAFIAPVLLALAALPTHAGRPMATEDAGVLERGECEWESFGARASERGSPSVRTLSTQVGCGVGASNQVALAIARDSGGGASATKLTLGGKFGLVERKDDDAGLTLAWGVVGARQGGSGLRHERTALNLVVSKEIAQGATGHANLGWARAGGESVMTWNLAGEHAMGNGVDLMVEFYGEQHSKPWLGGGIRLAATDKLFIDASYALQSGSRKGRLFTVGAKLVF